jgi:putative ABC transport system permease protein
MFDALVVGEARINPARAAITAIAIALGVGMWLALTLAEDAVERSLRADVALVAAPVDVRVTAPGRGVEERSLAAIRSLANVREARPVVEGNGLLAFGAPEESVRVVGVDLLQSLPGIGGFRQRGPGVFEPASAPYDRMRTIAADGAIVSAAVAGRLGLRTGSIARLSGSSREMHVPVAFVLPRGTTGVDSSVVFVDFHTAQALFDERGYFTRIDCLVFGTSADAAARLIRVLPSGSRVAPPAPETGTLGRLLDARARDAQVLAIIAGFVALSLVYNGIGASIALRRAEIGALRALGATRSAIFGAFVAEGAWYGAIGGSLGVGLAIVCVQPIAFLLLRGATHVEVEWWDLSRVGIAFAGGVVSSTAAALFPALGALRVEPARLTVSRGFEPRTPRVARALGALTAPLGASGTVGYLAARELGGSPRRTLVALIAFTVAVGATVAFTISDTSLRAALLGETSSRERADLVVRPSGFDEAAGNGAFAAGTGHRLRLVSGVGGITARRSFDVSVNGEPATLRAATGSGLAADRASISAPLAARLRLSVGDHVRLASPTGDVVVRIVAILRERADPGGEIFVDSALVAARFRDPRSDEFDIVLDPGVDPADVRRSIVRALEPIRIDVVTTREIRDQLLGALAGSFALADSLEAMTLGLSVAGLIVTLAGIVLERRREFAMLRSIGASRGLVVAVVRLEAATLCVAACVLGTAAGIAVAFGLAEATLEVPVARIALALSVCILATALAATYPARLAAAATAGSAGRAST